MKINLKKASILKKWILSYLLIMGLLIIIIFASIVISNNLIMKKLNEQKREIVLSMQNNIDKIFIDTEKVMLQIANESDIDNYLQLRNLSENELPFRAQLARDKIKNIMLGNSYIADIYIYSNLNNRILSSSSASTLELFYNTNHTNNFTFEKWRNILNGRYKNDYIYFTKKENNREIVEYIVNSTSLPLYYGNNFVGNMFILIDMKQFADYVEKNKIDDDTYLRILDFNNKEIYFDNGLCYIKDSEMDFNSLTNDTDIQADNNLVAFTPSNGRNFKYLLIETKSQIKNIMFNQAYIIFIFTILAVLICVFIAYKFAMNNYVLVKNIIRYFGKPEYMGNEFEVLDESVKKLMSEHNVLESRFAKQSAGACASILTRLLKGKITDYDEMLENLSWHNIYFKYPNFCVVGFYINDYGLGLNEMISNYEDDMYDISMFILDNIYSELISKKFPVYFTETENILVGLMNMPTNEKDNIDMLNEIFRHGIKIIKSEFKLSFFISVSEIKDKITDVPKLYNQMQENFEGIFSEHGKEIYVFNSEKKSIEVNDNQFNYNEQRIYMLIRNMNFNEAIDLIEVIYKDYLINSTAYMAKMRLYSLSFTVLEALNCLLDKALFDSIKDEIDILNIYIPARQYIETLKRIFRYVDERLDKNSNGKSFVEQVNEFIDLNYQNKDLDLSLISKQLNISVSVLAKEYKKYTNNTVLNYIHSVRIAKAKNLLINTSLMVKDIAEQVGYDYVITFIRIFKKKEGVTTTEYRELHRSKNNIQM